MEPHHRYSAYDKIGHQDEKYQSQIAIIFLGMDGKYNRNNDDK